MRGAALDTSGLTEDGDHEAFIFDENDSPFFGGTIKPM